MAVDIAGTAVITINGASALAKSYPFVLIKSDPHQEQEFGAVQVWDSIIIHAGGVQISHSTKVVHGGEPTKASAWGLAQGKTAIFVIRRGSFFVSKPW